MSATNIPPLEEIAYRRIDKYPGRPTVIFLHDSLGCMELWRAFPERFADLTQCNVLTYDRQGYGRSCAFQYAQRDNGYMELEADILNALLDHWKLDDVVLFGHSDGGSIALIAAGKYPDRIAGVVTEGAHIFVEDITLEGIREAARLYSSTDLKVRLEKYHGTKTEALFKAWTETWLSEPFRTWNIEEFLPSISCPALIIQGTDDEYGTLKQVDGIVNGTKGNAQSLIIPSIGHTPHKEAPELVLEKAGAFVLDVLSKA